ncbi:MAG: hypothetical protein C5B50_26760 [Verrucomicrobia bacterium]|nr:MAG: hypothetical protein C5B50_26760 [Verrucomicrobiota bacterium]
MSTDSDNTRRAEIGITKRKIKLKKKSWGALAGTLLVCFAARGEQDVGCTNATVITTPSYTNAQYTTNATGFSDVPSCIQNFSRGVWYRYTAPTNGALIVDTFGSDFDTTLILFSGACGSLTLEGCNDDAAADGTSRVSIQVHTGTNYFILAGGLDGTSGHLVLHSTFTTNLLANDLCAGAILISTLTYTNAQSTAGATSTDDGTTACTLPQNFGNGVWYKFTPPKDGSIVVDTLGSDYDTVLAIYTGTCGALSEAACNDDVQPNVILTSLVNMPVSAGTTYYMVAGSYEGGAYGNLQFHLAFTEGPPPNDQCSGALAISATSFTNTVATAHATSIGDPLPSCGPLSNGVWYAYTPSVGGVIFADTLGSDFNTVLAAYAGVCTNLTQVACNDDLNATNNNSKVSFLASALTNYYFLAGGYNSATGYLTFHMTFSSTTLANDQCGGALVVANAPYTNSQSTLTATSTGDPTPSCQSNFGNGVWYQYTPPAGGNGGTMTVDTFGSSFDTVLAVYSGGCTGLTEIGCNDDTASGVTSQVSNAVVAGVTYYIMAGGKGGQVGNLVFHLSFVEGPPTNDQCAGALLITNTSYTHAQSTAKATSVGDSAPTCAGLSNGVWYTYTPSINGVVEADTVGSDFDTVLAGYSGACGGLTPLLCNDMLNRTNTNSRVSILATAGTNYYFLAGGNNGATGNLAFHLNFTISTVPNDQCSGATLISGNASTNSQSSLGATSTGDSSPSCATSSANGIWYRYTAPTNGYLALDTTGSDYETVLGVYTGSCGTLTQVACNDQAGGTSQLFLAATSNTTYFVEAAGWGGQAGNLVLHTLLAQGPAVVTPPASQTVPIGGTATFTVTASGTPPLSYMWRRNGLAISGATGSSYTSNSVALAASGSQYSCVVSNTYNMATSAVATLSVVLTNTFQNTNLILINDNAKATPYPSTITLSGQLGVVGKVTVTLQGFGHTYPHDVGALLAGPQGQTVVLMADAGGGQPVTNLNLTFDDNATARLSEFGALASGSYRPGSPGTGDTFPSPAPTGPYGGGLYGFRGTSPNGTWSLYVLDDAADDSGTIAHGWTLNLGNDLSTLQITQQPQTQTGLSGGSVTFSVAAVGPMPITYSWQRSGTNLTDGGRLFGSATANLTITNLQSSDAAPYSVGLSCISGSLTSTPATLTVLPYGHPYFVPSSLKHYSTGQFQFTFLGTLGSNYIILESSDLQVWKEIGSFTMTNSSADMVDTTTNLARRFYRLKLGP